MALTITLIALAATLASAYLVWQQVREMKHQTALQREIADSAAQPYIWADVRAAGVDGWFLEFVVGNAGPTVATDVRVTVDPPWPEVGVDGRFTAIMHQRLLDGLSSLAPGRQLAWTLGTTPELVNETGSLAHVVTIDATGPHGPIPTSTYVLNLADYRETRAASSASLDNIARAIKEAAKTIADS